MPPSPLRLFLPLFALLLLVAAPGQSSAEPPSATLFVALKATSSQPDPGWQASLDRDLRQAATGLGMAFLDRKKTAAITPFEPTWPPSLAQVKKLAARHGQPHYVVCGQASRLGETVNFDLHTFDLRKNSHHTTFASSTTAEQGATLRKLAQEASGHSQSHQRIGAIEIQGNSRIDAGAIMNQIKTRQGDNFAPARLRDDLKEVFRMGFFDDVTIDVAESRGGKIVTFKVVEKEIIGKVKISGTDHIKLDEVKEIITVKANTIYNPNQVNKSASYIRQFYKAKGYYDTKVVTKISHPKEDYVDVDFVISEGKKMYIEKIIFHGNKTFTAKELRKVMASSEKGFFSWFTESGVLKRSQIKEDSDRIGAFYQNNGFVTAQVGEPVIAQDEDALSVTFQIKEGKRYRVGQIEVSGEMLDAHDRLLAMTKLGEERYFTREVLRNDVLALTDFYAASGYAFARVEPETHKDESSLRIDVTYHVSKGNLVHVNRILIRGNDRSRDKVIRREIALGEDDIYNAAAIKASTQRLKRLDYFEEVNITPEGTPEDEAMDVLVEVKEKSTGTFSIGAGYSSVDDLMFMGEISQNNFLGRGQRLALSANVGGKNTRYNLSFTEPHLNDSQLLFGFDIYSWEREYDYYTKTATGGAVRFGYPLWKKWRGYWSVGTDKSKVFDPEITAINDNGTPDVPDDDTPRYYDETNEDEWATLQAIQRTNFITLGTARDTRDRRYGPKRGSRHVISTKHAGGFLQGDAAYTKIEGSTSWYFPIAKNLVFHSKFATGYVHENEEMGLPNYERFFLGGLSTVRGFDNAKISPVDPLDPTIRIGGNKMCYTNQELIFPLFKDAGLDGVIFFDAGNSWDDGVDMDFSDLRYGAGGGFRWMSPMGPLRLEWGKNLDPRPDEDSSVWDFSIGGSF
ncbi:MAG: outer membrane protein assembly factor BamA [Thermodesulfobacteriota bacterium]